MDTQNLEVMTLPVKVEGKAALEAFSGVVDPVDGISSPGELTSRAASGSWLPKVLIVEDDEVLRTALVSSLEAEAYEVVELADGSDVLDVFDSQEFVLVVLDLMLPIVDGYELCRRIRTKQSYTPVLIITALGELGDKIRGFDAGTDDYLIKPFSMLEFAARVRALVRRGLSQRSHLLFAGDLRLDPIARRVWRGGEEILLAPREFEVLEVFFHRPGLVVSRRSILKAVWGNDLTITENILDQYIGHLRRKIDRPFGTSDLETVHRLGYRLKCEK